MEITTKFMTKNDCYKAGKKIIPKGIIFHSTATQGAMADAWYKAWNKSGVIKAVHFFVDDKSIYQYLPCEKSNIMRSWHGGSGPKGSVNNTHISIEMCEPKDLKDKEYFEKAYENMLDLCTYLCKEFGLSPETIIGHYEAYKLGIASNHGDPAHYINKMGKSMDAFRSEVKKRLAPTPKPAESKKDTKKEPEKYGKVTASVLNVREERGLKAKVIGQLKKGQKVKLCYLKDKWWSIDYGKSVGFVSAEYIEEVK